MIVVVVLVIVKALVLLLLLPRFWKNKKMRATKRCLSTRTKMATNRCFLLLFFRCLFFNTPLFLFSLAHSHSPLFFSFVSFSFSLALSLSLSLSLFFFSFSFHTTRTDTSIFVLSALPRGVGNMARCEREGNHLGTRARMAKETTVHYFSLSFSLSLSLSLSLSFSFPFVNTAYLVFFRSQQR